MNKIIQYLSQERSQIITFFFIATLSSQRYLLPDIYHFICFLPLILGLIYQNKNIILGNTYLIIALFTFVDIGGGGADVGLHVFRETSSIIRYSIYLAILSTIFIRYRININKIWIPVMLLIMPTIITVYNAFDLNFTINSTLLRGDIFVAIMTFLVLTNKNKKIFNFDNRLLCCFLIFYGFFEVINSLVYHDFTMGYSNYHSIKSLIVFPLIYSLVFFKSNLIKLILLLCTLIVLVGYTTRMIILSLILTLTIYYASKINLKSLTQILTIGLMIFVSIGISMSLFQYQGIGESIKVLNMIQILIDGDNILLSLQLVDPWRFGELQLLFDRNLFSIFFGEGFGSGVFDSKGYLTFADFGQTAYSDKELISGIFYNMHDLVTDYGLRFGLLFITVFLYDVIKNIIFSKNHLKTFYAMLLLILSLCAFFSSAGIILISVFYLNYMAIDQGAIKL
tara:strand:- start:875 stop:2230 length:1356 start_codon:yes stop_codon:yes gene_type:complete